MVSIKDTIITIIYTYRVPHINWYMYVCVVFPQMQARAFISFTGPGILHVLPPSLAFIFLVSVFHPSTMFPSMFYCSSHVSVFHPSTMFLSMSQCTTPEHSSHTSHYECVIADVLNVYLLGHTRRPTAPQTCPVNQCSTHLLRVTPNQCVLIVGQILYLYFQSQTS